MCERGGGHYILFWLTMRQIQRIELFVYWLADKKTTAN